MAASTKKGRLSSAKTLAQTEFERKGHERKTPVNVTVPQRQVNASALRFLLKASDVFWIGALIILSIWDGYVGTNNKGIIAPIAAGILGMGIFAASLLSLIHI